MEPPNYHIKLMNRQTNECCFRTVCVPSQCVSSLFSFSFKVVTYFFPPESAPTRPTSHVEKAAGIVCARNPDHLFCS